jgi:hypothetical protein
LLSLNALAASQEVLIPLQPHFLALQGFGKLLQTVDLVNKRINRDLKVTGVLLCMFDTRASLPNEVKADIEHFLNNARGTDSAWSDAQILPTFIRRNIKLAESPSYGQTIFEYDPTCNGAVDYRNVARFFVGLEPEFENHSVAESEAVAEPEGAPEPQEVPNEPESITEPESTSAPESATHEPHPEPMPAGEPDPAPPPQRESVPFRIREFQSPAPPLRTFPIPPAKPPASSHAADDAPGQTGDAQDEPHQAGF